MTKILLSISGALAWTAAVAAVSFWAGQDDITAEQVPALVQTIRDADTAAGKLQTTINDLADIGSAVQTSIANVNTAVDEANRRLADAGVMASCPAFDDRDVRLLNAAIDRIEAKGGLSGR